MFAGVVWCPETVWLFEFKHVDHEVRRRNERRPAICGAVQSRRSGTNHLPGFYLALYGGQAFPEMQLTRPSIVVKAIGRVGLLLRFHDDRARAQRMHGTTRDVNHLARVDG